MTGFVARRIVSALPTLVGISLVAFIILEVLPRAPLLTGPGAGTLSAGTEALLERAAADPRPAAARYAAWGAGLLQGDLGRSRRTGRPVTAILADALPWTLFLNLCAVAVIYGLAIPYGGLAAARRGSLADRLGGGLLLVLYAVPPFAAALLLQQGLAVRWPLLPLHGVPSAATGEAAGALPLLRHVILPAACLAVSGWAFAARYARAVFGEVLGQDFLRAARARGASHARAWRHAAAAAAVTFVTLLSALLPGLVGGSVIVEQIFSWPGVGSLYLAAIETRDGPVVLGLTLLSGAAVLLAQVVVDVLYVVVDPRMRDGLAPEDAHVA